MADKNLADSSNPLDLEGPQAVPTSSDLETSEVESPSNCHVQEGASSDGEEGREDEEEDEPSPSEPSEPSSSSRLPVVTREIEEDTSPDSSGRGVAVDEIQSNEKEDLSDISDTDSKGPFESLEAVSDGDMEADYRASAEETSTVLEQSVGNLASLQLQQVPVEKESHRHPRITHPDSLMMRETELDFEADVGDEGTKEGIMEEREDEEEVQNTDGEEEAEDKEPGECDEASPDVGGGGKDEKSDGEVKDRDDLEEGELSEEEGDRRLAQEPRPICRFYSKGQCTWGSNCRFLHPGVTDKGNYSMFDPPRPLVPVNGSPMLPVPDYRFGKMANTSYSPSAVKEEPVFESAWERGLRHAKEMLKKSVQRKETDLDFEEKKMNLTLGQEELDKENDYYTRSASPVVREAPNRDDDLYPYVSRSTEDYWRASYRAYEAHYSNSPPHPHQRQHQHHLRHHPEHQPMPPMGARDYPASQKQERMKGRRGDERIMAMEGERKRRVIPEAPPAPVISREDLAMEKPWREDRFGDTVVPSQKVRGDEWADPWMRSKSPIRKSRSESKHGGFSSASSYSSSRKSGGADHGASKASIKSGVRTALHGAHDVNNLPPSPLRISERTTGGVMSPRMSFWSSRSSSYSSSSRSSSHSSYSSYSSRSRAGSRSHSRSPSHSPTPKRKAAQPAPKVTSPRHKVAPPPPPKQGTTQKSGEKRVSASVPAPPNITWGLSRAPPNAPPTPRKMTDGIAPRKAAEPPSRKAAEMQPPRSTQPLGKKMVQAVSKKVAADLIAVAKKEMRWRRKGHRHIGSDHSCSRSRSSRSGSTSRSSSSSSSSSRSSSSTSSPTTSPKNNPRSSLTPSIAGIGNGLPPHIPSAFTATKQVALIMIDKKKPQFNMAKNKAMDALKLSGQKQQIKLTLKAPGAMQVNKRVLEKLSDEREPEIRSTEEREVVSTTLVPNRKRPMLPMPLIEAPPTKVAAMTKMAAKKHPSSRREELLKQLKAVEDAIARKRSKLGGAVN